VDILLLFAFGVGHSERRHLGHQLSELGVILVVSGLQLRYLVAELGIIGVRDVEGLEPVDEPHSIHFGANVRRMCQILPVPVEILEHVHGTPFELSSEVWAHDVRLHGRIGFPRLAKQIETCSALLLAEIGLECYAVDVKDHSSPLAGCAG